MSAPNGLGRMTHLQARRDAFQKQAEESIGKPNRTACSACGKDFLVVRPWQRQCSPRCRQRTYVQRQVETPMGYYGALADAVQSEMPTENVCGAPGWNAAGVQRSVSIRQRRGAATCSSLLNY